MQFLLASPPFRFNSNESLRFTCRSMLITSGMSVNCGAGVSPAHRMQARRLHHKLLSVTLLHQV